jgi:hypothetical protein
MSRRLLMRIVAVATIFFVPAIVIAQWAGGKIQINGIVPVSGDVEVTNRVDVSATTPPDTWLAVAGDSGGARLEVDIPNPVILTASTQALLAGQRNCTYTPLGRLTATPDGGVFYIAAGPSGGSFKAHAVGNNVDYVACWIHSGAGPYPNCVLGDGGVGFDLHNREVIDVDLATNLSWQMDCLTCVHAGAPAQDNALVTGTLSLCSAPP